MHPFPIAARVAALALLATLGPARAEECGPVSDKVAAATQAEIGTRSPDFVTFRAGPETSLTLACGGPFRSSVGAHFKGENPPDAYYVLFGKAGAAVTGIDAATLEKAAREARGQAGRQAHGKAEAGGALVTCSAIRSDKGALTMCAVIDKDERI